MLHGIFGGYVLECTKWTISQKTPTPMVASGEASRRPPIGGYAGKYGPIFQRISDLRGGNCVRSPSFILTEGYWGVAFWILPTDGSFSTCKWTGGIFSLS